MSSARSCSNCGTLLPDNAPEGALCPTCRAGADQGSTVIHKAPSAPALATIGDYEVIDKLGEGGMGAVYRARQTSLDRIVALKVLPEQAQQDEESISRFEREARVAAQLNHPNLVRVYTNGAVEGTHFIAMELVEGENLQQRLKRGALPIPEALRICADVARALQCGWNTAQLIHRDIKPSNIYLSRDGAVKLGDLGIAKSLLANTTGLTQTGTMMGTPHYISPEQARAEKNLDFRADIYSLGCTLFQCLTGRTPYSADDPLTLMNQHLTAPPPALMKALPGAPMILARLVGKMLKKSKHERHASYADLIAEMDWVREQIESGATNTGPTGVAQAWKQLNEEPVFGTPKLSSPRPATATAPAGRSRLPLYGTIAAGVLVLGVLAFVLTRPAKPPSRRAMVAPSATPASAPPRTVASDSIAWRDGLATLLSTPQLPPYVAKAGNVIRASKRAGIHFTNARFTDVALRATAWAEPSAKSWDIVVRGRGTGGPDGYMARLFRSGKGALHIIAEGKSTEHAFPLPAGFSLDDRHTLELRAVGDRLTIFLDGKKVFARQDGSYTTGVIYVLGDDGTHFEKIEYADLAGAAPPSPAPAAAARADASPSSAGWEPLIRGPVGWRAADGSGYQEIKDGLLHLHNAEPSRAQPSADGAIRARIRFLEGTKSLILFLRSVPGVGRYLVGFNPTAVELQRAPLSQGSAGRAEILGKFTLPTPLSVGDTLQLELRVEGQRLTVLVNGAPAIEIDDDQLTGPGRWGAYAFDGWFESIEVQEPPVAPQGASLDLLPLVDVKRDGIKGWWRVNAEGISVDKPADFAALELPYEPPEEYNVDVVFTPTTEGNNANVLLAAGGASFAWKVNAHGRNPPIHGFDLLDGKHMTARTEAVAENPARLVVGERCSTTVQVRRGSITCFFKGEQVMKWSGDFSRLSMEEGSRLRNPRALGIGSYKRGITFHRVTVREMSGKGRLTAAASPSLPASSPSPATAAPAATGEWIDGLAEWWAKNGKGNIRADYAAREADGLRIGSIASVKAWEMRGGDLADVAIRATVRDANSWNLCLRASANSTRYRARIDPSGGSIAVEGGGVPQRNLTTFRTPSGFNIKEPHMAEFRALGDTLTLLLDGQEVATARDATLSTGGGYVIASPGAFIEKLEYRTLAPTVER